MLGREWNQLRQKYAMYLHLLDAIPADRFHLRPAPGMRTPAELVVQMSGSIVRDIAQGTARGKIQAEESIEARIVADLGTKVATIAFAKKCWDEASRAVAAIEDAHLCAVIDTPWNMRLSGGAAFNLLNDEFLHHYGQLYTCARLCGAKPFEPGANENIPQFVLVE